MASPVWGSKKWTRSLSTASSTGVPGRVERRGVDPGGEDGALFVGQQRHLVGALGVRRGACRLGVDAGSVDGEHEVGLCSEFLHHRRHDPHARQVGRGVVGVGEIGRPDANDHGPLLAAQRRAGGQGHLQAGEHDAVTGDGGLHEVHARRADERPDEQVDGVAEQLLGGVTLLQHPVAQHRHPLAQGHRLGLVVGHEQRRGLQPAVQAHQLRTHRHTQLGVEVRQRLVHQERRRLTDHRPAHRHPLSLPTRQRRRLAVQQLPQTQRPSHGIHLLGALGLGDLAHPQPETEVLAHRHVRVQGVVLEHHGDVTLRWRQVGHIPITDRDRPVRDLLEAGDHPQHRRLATPRGADEHHELPVVDVQRQVVHGAHAVGVHLRAVIERYRTHIRPPDQFSRQKRATSSGPPAPLPDVPSRTPSTFTP